MLYTYLKNTGKLNEKCLLKTYKLAYGVGMAALAIGLLIKNVGSPSQSTDFFEGFFMALSVTMNIYAAIMYRKSKRKERA